MIKTEGKQRKIRGREKERENPPENFQTFDQFGVTAKATEAEPNYLNDIIRLLEQCIDEILFKDVPGQ